MKKWTEVRWCALAVLAAMLAPPVLAAPLEDPTSVRAMLSSGAHELALAQVEALQPRVSSGPRWAEWEGLRCEALARLGRRDALLARASALAAERYAAPLNPCLVEAARAALAQADPQAARSYAAKLLWQADASAAESRAARLVVIDSYLEERRGDDAFSSMLRFEQDYRPLDRETSERFAQRLLDLERDVDALHWIAGGSSSAARLRLQLRSGTLTPEMVITQARAAVARDPNPAYWRAIHEAAARSRDGSLQVEALERLLQSVDARDEAAQNAAAQRLWQAYLASASEVGNREQLLMGDDGAWADYAARRLGSDPFLSRAFYAYLAQRAQNRDIRRNAQLQLAYSLYSSGLGAAALRAMQRIGFEIEALDEQTRYLLGTISSKNNDYALTLKLWNGLPTPPNVNAIEWQLTLARTALQAGDASASADTVKRLLEGRTSVTPQLAQRVLELGQEMLDMRTIDAALTVYELVVPLSNDGPAREALFGLGRAYELAGEPVRAAAHYLRSALLVQAVAPDALAFQARLLAALNLMRAGLRNDARAQFEWLLKNSKDPALTEAAKRGLARL
ncbi:MAG TPA: hypothetical protein VD867_12655 [Burkholderiales bacterium]|nr:hypothetical protein [Burkholderiales bacterium]